MRNSFEVAEPSVASRRSWNARSSPLTSDANCATCKVASSVSPSRRLKSATPSTYGRWTFLRSSPIASDCTRSPPSVDGIPGASSTLIVRLLAWEVAASWPHAVSARHMATATVTKLLHNLHLATSEGTVGVVVVDVPRGRCGVDVHVAWRDRSAREFVLVAADLVGLRSVVAEPDLAAHGHLRDRRREPRAAVGHHDFDADLLLRRRRGRRRRV